MKPKHYLLSMAALGLLMMIPVAWVVSRGEVLSMMLNWFAPLLVGGAFTVGVAACLDYLLAGRRLTVLFSLASSFGIFALGVAGGATTNFFLYAKLDGNHGLYQEFIDWFVKP